MSAEAAAGEHAKSAREGAPPAAVPSRWRSLWAKAPKSVLMVLFGAAVTAWLVPAFTRQWQDRQKEREIKVALVSEIGDSTSDSLVTSQFVAGGALTNGQAEYNRVSLDWARRSAQVEASWPPTSRARLSPTTGASIRPSLRTTSTSSRTKPRARQRPWTRCGGTSNRFRAPNRPLR